MGQQRKSKSKKLLQAYQRLAKLLPSPDTETVICLLEEGLHSALAVVKIPKEKFLAQYGSRFEAAGFDADAFYENAVSVKTSVLLEYMRMRQQGEPHISQTNLQSKI